MTELLTAFLVGILAYHAGRVSPSPLHGWELTIRRRIIEWRIHWIDDGIKRAEVRRSELVAWYERGR